MFGWVPSRIKSGQKGEAQHGNEPPDDGECAEDTFAWVKIRGKSALVSEKTLDDEREEETGSGDAACNNKEWL